MNKLIVLFSIIFLTACGVTGFGSESEKTDYILKSCGDAGVIKSFFTGDVKYCNY